MGSVNVSQIVDYEGYSSEYAYATISWDESLKVTVNITSSNVVTWRIRGQGGDSREYCVGTGGSRYGTFYAENGKTYAFQIYSQTYSKYSDGDLFTVEIGSGDSGGDSGDSPTARTLYVNQGEGTLLHVRRNWPPERTCHKDLLTGEDVYCDGTDVFYVSVEALEGYNLDYYSFNGKQLGFKLDNFEYYTSDNTNDYYILASDEDASVTSTAKPKEYKLSASAGIGSYVTVTRTSSKKSGAHLGVLSNGATIYHFDTLEITVGVEGGYDIVDTIVSGCVENDDGSFTVTGNTKVIVTTELMGLVYIDNKTTLVPCLIFIDNGINWEQCIPYIDNGTSWDMCS